MISAAVVAVALAQAAGADAFVRTMTCQAGADPAVNALACREGETPVPIFWDSTCVTYHINEEGSADVTLSDVEREVQQGFDAWADADCSYLGFHYGGQTDEDRVGYSPCDGVPNANIVVFRPSDWRHPSQALALTSVTYDLNTGQIVDADIELNDEQFNFTVTDNPVLVRIDVQNTIAHEVGHLLGLDHSPESEATMFAMAPSGETGMRTLDSDDIAGVCDIYPSGAAEPSCPSSQAYFEAPTVGPGDQCPVEDTGCCAVAGPAGGGDRSAPLLIALVGLGMALVRRRRVERSAHLAS